MTTIATKTPKPVRRTDIDVKAENEDDGDNDVVDHANNDDETVSVASSRRRFRDETNKVFFFSFRFRQFFPFSR